VSKLEKGYKVRNWGFIGGAYGRSNERNMMIELMNNGPYVVSFEPAYTFMLYKEGIFHSVDETEWIKNGE